MLRITLDRSDFDWMLLQGVLSHCIPDLHGSRERWQETLRASPVIVQWDPERNLALQPLPHRTIQIGLRGEAISRYVASATLRIDDITDLACTVEQAVAGGDVETAQRLLPQEAIYPVPPLVARRLGIAS